MEMTTRTFYGRINDLSQPSDCREVYDGWAATYDTEIQGVGHEYVAPTLAAKVVVSHGGNLKGPILDAGCGTGLVGKALTQVGATNIDGIDISSGMLDIARKTGIYKDLSLADMSMELKKGDESYEVVTCVGTLTTGHVGPVPSLREFVRIARRKGLVVATVVDDVWVSKGFKAEIERLVAEGAVELVGTDSMDYKRGMNTKARMVVLRRK